MTTFTEPRRVLHVVDVAFHRTETFIYDFVTAAKQYESWVLARECQNTAEFPFDRVRLWDQRRPGLRVSDVWDRALAALRLRRLPPGHFVVKDMRPRVLHAHFGPAGWAALPLKRRAGLPLVTSFYGYDASWLPKDKVWGPRLQELIGEGEAFIAEGPAMKRRLVALGCRDDAVHVVPLVVHAERYAFRPRQIQYGETLNLLFVARFVPKKGLDVLLQALGIVGKEIEPFKLRVVGDGPERPKIDALVNDLGLGDSVVFLGFLPRVAVIEELQNAHILAVPSVTASDGDTEGGAPTILLEAQACGLPIVSTTHADIPFVCPTYTDFLASEGSVESLAEKLVALRRASGRWGLLAQDARTHLCQQHCERTVAALEAVYGQVERNPRRGRR